MARPDPLQEALDPATDPERLGELAEDEAVRRVVLRNPSLPEGVWREALIDGWPEAWANPMTPFYILTWTPREEDSSTLEDGVRWATEALWSDPERCSAEGKALLATKNQEWWVTSTSGMLMGVDIGLWASAKGMNSIEHREAVRILADCLLTIPRLEDDDRRALELLKAWSVGGDENLAKANDLASLLAVYKTVQFAHDPSFDVWHIFHELRISIFSNKQSLAEREEAEAKHDRLMADVIRRAMPLPPVVD